MHGCEAHADIHTLCFSVYLAAYGLLCEALKYSSIGQFSSYVHVLWDQILQMWSMFVLQLCAALGRLCAVPERWPSCARCLACPRCCSCLSSASTFPGRFLYLRHPSVFHQLLLYFLNERETEGVNGHNPSNITICMDLHAKKQLSLACRTNLLLLATTTVWTPPATPNKGITFLPVEAQHSASSWSQALTARAPASPPLPCCNQDCPQLGSYQRSSPAAPTPPFQPHHCWGAAVCAMCYHLGFFQGWASVHQSSSWAQEQLCCSKACWLSSGSPGAKSWHFFCLFLIVICLPELSIWPTNKLLFKKQPETSFLLAWSFALVRLK